MSRPTATGSGKTVSPSLVGGGNMVLVSVEILFPEAIALHPSHALADSLSWQWHAAPFVERAGIVQPVAHWT